MLPWWPGGAVHYPALITSSRDTLSPTSHDVLTDGGTPEGDETSEADENTSEADDERARPIERSSVDIRDEDEVEPADPKWERPDPEDIPEFELRAGGPVTSSGASGSPADQSDPVGPTAGRPNDARAPGSARIKKSGTEGYVVALELAARLPEDVRLPEEAADLVPAAVEAELEQDVQAFAAAEFDNPEPTVHTLAFEDVDGELWLRLRIGIPPESFDDLDPDEIRRHALQQLDGLF